MNTGTGKRNFKPRGGIIIKVHETINKIMKLEELIEKKNEDYLREAYEKSYSLQKFQDAPGRSIILQVGESALNALRKDIQAHLYDPKRNRPRQSPDDITFSETVFIIDEEGLHGLAFFSFEDDKWNFLTDTLVDYDEPGNETEWRWYYPPVTRFKKEQIQKR